MWEMPWTDSATLIEERIEEELLKRGQGDLKVEFSIPINWIDEFDVFMNLRLQEPFGLDASTDDPETRGEAGHYYYIESMTYDFMNQKINIVAVDLQWLLRQIMVVAHCGDVPEKWEDASESDKMYAYVGDCDSESFVSDGSPLKRISSCISCE